MIGSLFAGISGLNSNAAAMTVIGDNIANVNTTAYKSNRASFANVLSSSLAGSSSSDGIGRGVEYWATTPAWTQGSLENTASPTDLSVNGKGFFVVADETGSHYYTRAGQFHLSEIGDLVNPDGLDVMGYEIDSNGSLGNLTQISIPGERISQPSASTTFTFDINLDASTAAGGTYTTSQSIFDSLGNAIPLTLTFTRQAAAQTWSVAGSVDAPNGPVTLNGGNTVNLVFDETGQVTQPAADVTVAIAMSNGADDPLSVTWDLYDASGNGFGDLTGFASPSTTTFQYQDGYSAGMLRGISVDEEGIITGTYSNGQLVPMYQIALADFPSYEGLTKLGKNLYAESLASGQPMPGVAGNGRLGSISPNTLEMSNVDLAQEFVKMITTQRAFQANSRVITTSDEILNELINIKR
jgi:flagellar hook protein FlgE